MSKYNARFIGVWMLTIEFRMMRLAARCGR